MALIEQSHNLFVYTFKITLIIKFSLISFDLDLDFDFVIVEIGNNINNNVDNNDIKITINR